MEHTATFREAAAGAAAYSRARRSSIRGRLSDRELVDLGSGGAPVEERKYRVSMCSEWFWCRVLSPFVPHSIHLLIACPLMSLLCLCMLASTDLGSPVCGPNRE